MGRASFGWWSIGLSMLVFVGCGDGTPPLDELPLRDTLRADPAVVAALGDSARQRLAARFEAAVTEDTTSDAVADRPTPASEVTSLDEARVRRAADALVMGTIGDGVARPVALGVDAQTPLPELEGEAARPRRRSRDALSTGPQERGCGLSWRHPGRNAWSASSVGRPAPSPWARRSTSTPPGWWPWRLSKAVSTVRMLRTAVRQDRRRRRAPAAIPRRPALRRPHRRLDGQVRDIVRRRLPAGRD